MGTFIVPSIFFNKEKRPTKKILKSMKITISTTKAEMGLLAAQKGASFILKAIEKRGFANIIVATGASQFEMLAELVRQEIDWSVVTAFHLDEYIGLPDTHPASFRKYLKERFAGLVPLREFNYVNAETDPSGECNRLGNKILDFPIDVAFIGIGENGHIAFNDPPADFETEEPYLVVNLDEACRRQQFGEGWFPTLSDVPDKAISMSVRHIMKSKAIICTVPDERKADAVFHTLNSPVSPGCPATILRTHPEAYLFLDKMAALKLNK
jgi:glucosamine-6-phosphate deaminase